MRLEELAACLEKLGNPTRLAVFRLLVRAGHAGMPVGELQSRLRVPASTLSHHILFLITVGLIKQEREGRVLRCKPNFDRMHAVVKALTAECCAGVPPRRAHASAPKHRKAAARRRGKDVVRISI
jgi:ArsR family transcriptional regulator, arsenate/arsenite/antimonite-responsive transcriptional repressor